MRYQIEALEDDIAALATPPGPALEAVIRVTGLSVFQHLSKIISLNDPNPFEKKKGFHLGSYQSSDGLSFALRIYHWRAPNSYSGQDLAEIHFPASSVFSNSLLDSLVQQGVRLARRGEFTLRGFLNGKLDISQVDAIHQVIEATDAHILENALSRLAGGLLTPLKESREDLLNLLADVEANLDFAHEDISFIAEEDLLRRITHALAKVTLTIRKMENRSLTGQSPRVVLAGPPNAGKSTLFNSLLGAKSALVSPIPGSTRDFLQSTLVVDGITMVLVDTPGVESAKGGLEKTAQELASREWEMASVIVFCAEDNHQPWLDRFSKRFTDKVFLPVATKSDLSQGPPHWIAVSSLTQAGLGKVRAEIVSLFYESSNSPLGEELEKTQGSCKKALENLRRAHHLALFNEPMELLALELREAVENLGMVLGHVFTDDLLDRMFSRFCVGK
ncbi:MAG: GTP-binding protein [Gemmataceae bacterium]|nr:GTP-binding protein [Gemmataceae bacterium]